MDSPSAGLRRLWYESWLSVTVLERAAQRHLPGSPSGRPKGLAARTTQTTNSPTSVAECLSPNIWACNARAGSPLELPPRSGVRLQLQSCATTDTESSPGAQRPSAGSPPAAADRDRRDSPHP